MNNTRRKQIKEAREQILGWIDKLSDFADEEQEYYHNMPEGIQMGEKGDLALEAIDLLQEIHAELTEACEEPLSRIDEIV